jgi:hypothetical protein
MIVSTTPPDLPECVRLMHFREIFLRFRAFWRVWLTPFSTSSDSLIRSWNKALTRQDRYLRQLGRQDQVVMLRQTAVVVT